MTEQQQLTAVFGEEHGQNLMRLASQLPDGRRQKWVSDLLASVGAATDCNEEGEVEEPVGNLDRLLDYKADPVSVEDFMLNPFYLGKAGEVYPVILEELININSGQYDEAILTGGIGAGKTSIALYTQAYQLYQLSCLRDPHRMFNLDRSSEIKIVFQNLNKSLAKGIDYQRFRSLMEASPYFSKHFPFDRDIESMMRFPNRIEVEPISGMETAAIGANVIGGIVDEVNFMQVVERSKQATDGGVYDQAIALYTTIAMRRKSRFTQTGRPMPGLLCLVSSKKYPGQFTDIKEEEALTNPRIYVYNKRVWEIKPPGQFSTKFFPIFIGDEQRKPRVLGPDEMVADEDRPLIDHIPMDFWDDFAGPRADIITALRNIAGKSTLAIHPFIANREAVTACFHKRDNIFALDCIDFVTRLPAVLAALCKHRPDCPRWVHIDLGLTSDSAGLAIGHVPEFIKVDRGQDTAYETLPIIELDGILEIEPPRNGEIDFASIRRILYRLRDMGLNLRWLTMDSYQSADTLQIMRQQGFVTGYQSIDTSNEPYDIMRQALYDGRIRGPPCRKIIGELLSLEKDLKKGKIDHPPRGSKDLSDALAGVCYGLTTRREIWAQHKVPISQAHSISSVARAKQAEHEPDTNRPGYRSGRRN